MIEVVAGVITDHLGRVLACQRPPGKSLAGKWEFPGGKVESGESREVALKRELMEELGIQVQIVRPMACVRWDYPDITICLSPWLCRISEGEPVLKEHSALQWCSQDDWQVLDWVEADLPVLQEWLLQAAR